MAVTGSASLLAFSPNEVRPMMSTIGRAAPLLAGVMLTGCSLFTIKSPETPLTTREQEARLLTRDYAAHFATTVTHLIDDAARRDTDPAMRSQALRLKLGAVGEITRASTGLSPIASLLDTWAFSLQFRDFLATGSGAELLGNAQPGVRLGGAGARSRGFRRCILSYRSAGHRRAAGKNLQAGGHEPGVGA